MESYLARALVVALSPLGHLCAWKGRAAAWGLRALAFVERALLPWLRRRLEAWLPDLERPALCSVLKPARRHSHKECDADRH